MKFPNCLTCSPRSRSKVPWSPPIPRARDAQKQTARYVVEVKKADYLFTVKDNQPSNKTSPIFTWKRFPPQHTTLDKGHGRLEVRRLWASSELEGYLDFPYAAQVYRLERLTTELTTGKFRAETVHRVTRLSAEEADPVRLLSLNRSPWSIENGLSRYAGCAT